MPRRNDIAVTHGKLPMFLIAAALVWSFVLCGSAFAQSNDASGFPEPRVLIPQAARHFGAATSWKPDEWKLSLTYEDRTAEILIGSDRLIVDDYLMILSAPVSADGGTVTMTLGDSVGLFSRLLDRKVSEREISSAGLILRKKAKAVEENLIRSVRYISYPRFTRIIINISGRKSTDDIEVKLLEGAGTLTLELPLSRFAQPAETIEVGGNIIDLIEQVQTSSDAKLIVRTVPEKIRHELQKHDDPPRVVIDISPATPQIINDFLTGPDLPERNNGWREQRPVAPRGGFPFTTVVIDPGHGGKDNGAHGRGGLYEKEVTLAIALKLKELIEEERGMKVVLTRTGDYFVPLKERTAIANHAKEGLPADLFISIHTNAHKSPKVGGFEAFYISDAIDPDAEATAVMENAVIALETDEDDPAVAALTPILWDLQFTEFIAQSSELASLAQREMAKRLITRDRGVRQARFIVLAGVAMPSILIEVGFISNRMEEAKLKTADFRNKCALALADTVKAFKQRLDVRLGLLKEESDR